MSLTGLTVLITGASRGIGKALALRCATHGANIIATGKTSDPHAKLKGTINETAQQIKELHGECLPLQLDVRDEENVKYVVSESVKQYGRIDILINNAGAIYLTNTLKTSMKQYDLMNSVNARGTYLMSKYCINHMKKSKNAHILNLSPPINLNPVWLKNHAAYTLSKYGMSMFTIAMSHELRPFSIKVNSLWPQTAIYTAAMERLGGGDGVKKFCRSSEILCDAVEEIFKDGSDKNSGNLYIDEELLRKKGHIDFEKYSLGDATLLTDFFIGDSVPTDFSVKKDVNIQKIVEKVAKSINNDMIQQVGAKFIVDFGETKYILDLKKNGTFQEKQKNEESTDATLKISAEDFSNIMSGKSSAMDAYVSGRLHIEGDIECAMKLANVINK